MLLVCWSPKGGSGTSVVAAAVALQAAARGPAVLVDLAGDQPALLGLAAGDRGGIVDWAAAPPEVAVDAIGALAVPVVERLELIPRGEAPIETAAPERLTVALEVLATRATTVVVDAGTVPRPRSWWPAVARPVAVVRPCYLALRRLAAVHPPPGTPVVLVEEPGRALTVADVEDAIGVAVVVRVPWDPAVARAVDAGLLTSRSPRVLRRLGALASEQARR